jgi:hypothetical protein
MPAFVVRRKMKDERPMISCVVGLTTFENSISI